jgi:hypothetical protein
MLADHPQFSLNPMLFFRYLRVHSPKALACVRVCTHGYEKNYTGKEKLV